MARRRRTSVELNRVSEDLRYEVQMLHAAAQGLASQVLAPSPAHNALIESFAIHARNLIDFFWLDSDKSDDVLAADFFTESDRRTTTRPQISPLLTQTRKRANKLVAHLTYTRIEIDPRDKQWPFIDIATELDGVFKFFVSKAPREVVQALFPLEP
jgi:hypothetical protein